MPKRKAAMGDFDRTNTSVVVNTCSLCDSIKGVFTKISEEKSIEIYQLFESGSPKYPESKDICHSCIFKLSTIENFKELLNDKHDAESICGLCGNTAHPELKVDLPLVKEKMEQCYYINKASISSECICTNCYFKLELFEEYKKYVIRTFDHLYNESPNKIVLTSVKKYLDKNVIRVSATVFKDQKMYTLIPRVNVSSNFKSGKRKSAFGSTRSQKRIKEDSRSNSPAPKEKATNVPKRGGRQQAKGKIPAKSNNKAEKANNTDDSEEMETKAQGSEENTSEDSEIPNKKAKPQMKIKLASKPAKRNQPVRRQLQRRSKISSVTPIEEEDIDENKMGEIVSDNRDEDVSSEEKECDIIEISSPSDEEKQKEESKVVEEVSSEDQIGSDEIKTPVENSTYNEEPEKSEKSDDNSDNEDKTLKNDVEKSMKIEQVEDESTNQNEQIDKEQISSPSDDRTTKPKINQISDENKSETNVVEDKTDESKSTPEPKDTKDENDTTNQNEQSENLSEEDKPKDQTENNGIESHSETIDESGETSDEAMINNHNHDNNNFIQKNVRVFLKRVKMNNKADPLDDIDVQPLTDEETEDGNQKTQTEIKEEQSLTPSRKVQRSGKGLRHVHFKDQDVDDDKAVREEIDLTKDTSDDEPAINEGVTEYNNVESTNTEKNSQEKADNHLANEIVQELHDIDIGSILDDEQNQINEEDHKSSDISKDLSLSSSVKDMNADSNHHNGIMNDCEELMESIQQLHDDSVNKEMNSEKDLMKNVLNDCDLGVGASEEVVDLEKEQVCKIDLMDLVENDDFTLARLE